MANMGRINVLEERITEGEDKLNQEYHFWDLMAEGPEKSRRLKNINRMADRNQARIDEWDYRWLMHSYNE